MNTIYSVYIVSKECTLSVSFPAEQGVPIVQIITYPLFE